MKKTGIGIDIGMRALRFAKLEVTQEQVKLVKLYEFSLPGREEENFSTETAQKLRAFLHGKENKYKKALVGISGAHLSIRYLRTPTVSASRLAEIVKIDMAQIIETASADLVYSYLPLDLLEDKDQPEQTVLVAIARSSFLEQIRGFFCEAGICVQGFVPSVWGLYQTFVRFAEQTDKQPVYLAHLDEPNLNLAVADTSKLYFLRNTVVTPNVSHENTEAKQNRYVEEDTPKKVETAPQAMPGKEEDRKKTGSYPQVLSKAKEVAEFHASPEQSPQQLKIQYLESIPDVLEASVKYAKVQTKSTNLKFSRLCLTGEESQEPEVQSLLESRFRCPVERITLRKNLQCGDDIKELPSQEHKFMLAVGLAWLATLPDIPLKIFSSRQQMHELIFGRRIFEYAALAVVILSALIASAVCLTVKHSYQTQQRQWEQKRAELQGKSEVYKQVCETNKNLKARLSSLLGHALPNTRILETLSWLEQNLPPQIYFQQIEFQKVHAGKIPLLLYGVVEESSLDVYTVLNNFQKLLQKSPYRIVEEKIFPFRAEESKLEFKWQLAVPLIPE